MATPYIGEIRLFAGNFAPAGWALCHGQLLPISENETLFQLIGTTYGGDGQNTFALPDLRGRVPIHQSTLSGQNFGMGQPGGAESVTLGVNEIPAHTHALLASTELAITGSPQGAIPAQTSTFDFYQSAAPDTAMSTQSIGAVGGSQPHTNLQPYLCVNSIISLFGVFPSPT